MMDKRRPADDAPWGLVPPPAADASARAEVEALRAASPRLTAVLDDDPTGSQSVRDVQIVLSLEAAEYREALRSGACFVLTNSRSLGAAQAAEVAGRVADDLFAIAADTGRRVELISRSDSTLRGHVLPEVRALSEARVRATGSGFDAVLFAPAFIEAGRVTADDVHWAAGERGFRPVSETEFARDPSFGYRCSNLRDFLVERGGGEVPPGRVTSIGLADIREHGPRRVAELIAAAPSGAFVIVNALAYSDLEIAARGALLAEDQGAALLYRTGPSFVRALLGQGPSMPLTPAEIWPAGRPHGHGLVVVGSHVGRTSRQLAALDRLGGWSGVELDVGAFLAMDGPAAERFLADIAARACDLLSRGDVVISTSRRLVRAVAGADDLEIARRVSAAMSSVAGLALAAQPAWVLAKGGITAHDVAVRGLRMRRAEVAGQFFPGLVSMLRPLSARPEAVGRPYVIFAGNVGDDNALADVARRLRG